jgi:hypothetical protein
VQKGGTTSLHTLLAQHPDLAAPSRKEPHCFDDESQNWDRPDLAAYHALYPPADHRQRYDGTPVNSYWRPALARIKAYNPQAKLIFLFRDPFARAWSHWCMEWGRGAENLPFAQAIRRGRARMPLAQPSDPAWRSFSYIERGFYGRQVARALALFPRQQLLFLKSEDLERDQAATLQRIAAFLAIAPFPDLPVARENCRSDPAFPMSPYPALPSEQDRAWVANLLAQDMALFAALTGLDISGWRGEIALNEPPMTHVA